ncbi:pentatricopeptide repeat-containing protein At3g61520, mitochondrial-like [Rosa rugosa]|uniref:pentatricopeptide repeat-containing protein At3g61520, mitochondrial-like n=1 Tax=Rosa rugosa TaxID=74645 RepID=UPI002B408835|nr:pentatricopeptide repeat-containing protein At3g61520, mitochondrial-like [Rosa rugosa]XP_062030632.1 pentatricopeptide repeat-containing protein At3g61520, mitochondrial-like [Rosa rugosa]
MKSLSLSASSHSKPLLHLLKPQTPKSKSPVFLLLSRHLCANPNSNPNQPPQDDYSLVTQVLQLLRPNEKDWNFDRLHTLLFPNSTSPSTRSLFLITRRLGAPSKALKFFDYVSVNVAGTPPGSKALLSTAFQALLELTLREPTSENKLFELYKMAKDRNVPLNLKAAGLLVRSMGAAGMEDEALVVFNELHLGLKTTHIRNVVIRMLLKIGRVDDALKVLDEMLHPEAKFRVDDFTGDVVIGSLLRREQIGRSVSEEEIVELVSRFGKHGVFPNNTILTKLVTVLCRNRKVGIAWDVLHDVMKMGGAVEAAPCNALLTALGRGNDFKRMSELMAKMEEMGIKPDVITFGILVNRLCKSRRIDAALEVFEKMSGGVKGVSAEPDVIIYNTLIDGLCKVGRQEEGLRLMGRMRSQGGCAPNTVTYNCLIDGFNKVGDIDRGRELFDKMKEEGIPLNAATLNTLLDGLCRHGRLNTAFEFFNEMQRDGLKGNAVTYTILITSFCNVNNISKAMELFNQMLRAECPTDAIVYHCLISGLSQAGRMEDASFVVSKLKEASFSMDIVSYNVMINGFSSKNKPDKIHEMIEEMEASGVKPDSVTYNTLLAYLSKAGDFKSAHKVLDRMMDEGIVPTVVTFGTLIHAHCLDGDIDKAMRIFRDMGSKSKIPPNTVIYNDLINSLCKKNDVEQALYLMEDMKEKEVRPNTQTFNALFKGLRENNLLKKAFQFMDRMVEQACNPDYITMEILTEWLSGVGEIERLRKFVQGYPVSKPQLQQKDGIVAL